MKIIAQTGESSWLLELKNDEFFALQGLSSGYDRTAVYPAVGQSINMSQLYIRARRTIEAYQLIKGNLNALTKHGEQLLKDMESQETFITELPKKA